MSEIYAAGAMYNLPDPNNPSQLKPMFKFVVSSNGNIYLAGNAGRDMLHNFTKHHAGLYLVDIDNKTATLTLPPDNSTVLCPGTMTLTDDDVRALMANMPVYDVTVRFSGNLDYQIETGIDPEEAEAWAEDLAENETRIGAIKNVEWEAVNVYQLNADMYNVTVKFSGAIDYQIQAINEDAAKAKANQMAEDETRLGDLTDIDWEVKGLYKI